MGNATGEKRWANLGWLGAIWIALGNVERTVAWVSGTIFRDANSAAANVKDALASTWLFGDPIAQTVMVVGGMMMLSIPAWYWLAGLFGTPSLSPIRIQPKIATHPTEAIIEKASPQLAKNDFIERYHRLKRLVKAREMIPLEFGLMFGEMDVPQLVEFRERVLSQLRKYFGESPVADFDRAIAGIPTHTKVGRERVLEVIKQHVMKFLGNAGEDDILISGEVQTSIDFDRSFLAIQELGR